MSIAAPSPSSRRVPIALLYQAPALHAHLKQALTELGARVVYDTPAAAFDRTALTQSGAEVVVINLDPDVDEEFEHLGDLLADEQLKVIFNDGEVSSRLEGWDQARWARHLAAKILGVEDMNPPRPAGASSIPVRVKSSAVEQPGEVAKDGSFHLHGNDFAAALNADTSDAISRTRAALVTKDEPVALKLEKQPGSGEAPTLELPVGSLLGNIPESGFSQAYTPVEPEPGAPVAHETVLAEFDSVLRDFGSFAEGDGASANLAAESLDPASRDAGPARAAVQPAVGAGEPAGAAANPFDALMLDGDFAAASTLDATVELQIPPAVRAASGPTAKEADAFDDFSLDLELDAGSSAAATSAAFDELSLENAAEATPADTEFDLGAMQFEDFDLGGATPAPARDTANVPTGLDDVLDRMALDALEAGGGKVPSAAPTIPAAAPARPATAPRSEQPAAGAVPRKPVIRDDFLNSLSLEPVDDEVAGSSATPPRAPVVPARPEPRAVPAPRTATPPADAAGKFDLSGLSLEPIEGDEGPVPTGRATYKLDHSSAAASPVPAAAPSARGPGTPAATFTSDDGLSLEGLDFDLDEVAPIDKSSLTSGNAPSDEPAENELMAELEAMVAQTERAAAASAAATAPGEGPVRRVWVLGASIGGPEAVREFLAAMPPDAPALFLLAQHMGSDFLELMTQQLARATSLRVRHVVEGDSVAHGEVVIVPLGHRIRVDQHGTVKLSSLEAMSPYSPSIDQVLMDVADRFGADAGAIIFSGMAHDAIDGSIYLAQKGGRVWVQDPATCVISSMVDGARDAGVVSFTGAPAELAQHFQLEFSGAR